MYSDNLKRLYIAEKIMITDEFERDLEIKEHVKKHARDLNSKLEQQVGYSAVHIEGRFDKIRSDETNLGNLIADLIRSEFDADFGLSNAGGLRADALFEEGSIKMNFMARVVPITEKVVKGSMTGANLKEIME